MITLNYKTRNPRWGLSGIEFQNWENYSFVLGYLSNLEHYINFNKRSSRAYISVHIERNDRQGAWNKEGRIHYYDSLNSLRCYFYDLYVCSSAGVGNIVRRINSNGYILSLINDYDFEVCTHAGKDTASIFPSQKYKIEDRLKQHFISLKFSDIDIEKYINCFNDGYNF